MTFDKTKFLVRFIEEAREHVVKINDGLLILEKSSDKDALDAVFRSAHTLKGASRMMSFIPISELAHKLESALDALRQEKIQKSGPFSDLLFRCIDTISEMVEKAASGEALAEIPEKLGEELERAADGKVSREIQPGEIMKAPFPKSEKQRISDKQSAIPDSIRISGDRLDRLIKLIGEIASGHHRLMYLIKEFEKLSAISMDLLPLIKTEGTPTGYFQKKPINTAVTDLFYGIQQAMPGVKEHAGVLEHLIEEFQDMSLQLRMLPLSTLFNAFQRTVRDISREFGKEIDFLIEGGETELDKKMIEKLGDPLLHMIRNSIDHGIEDPVIRKQKGKPEVGEIKLKAGYEGENVLIELSDDGAGISVDKIKEKAIKKNLLDKEQIDILPHSEIINLIFQPGFSTSDMITDLSGRGVGMDVVQKNIREDLKGAIRIETKQDHGTTFFIRLPLTMAIMHVLSVGVGDMAFAVPSNFIDEIITVGEEDLIDVVGEKAVRRKDQVIPVVALADLLRLKTNGPRRENDLLIFIVTTGGEYLGLLVNSLLAEEYRTVKPLPSHLRTAQWISGVTISSQNKIENVLHIPKIMDVVKEVKIEEMLMNRPKPDKKTIHILVVDDSISTREIEKSILESYGYNVTIAGDGVEALKNAQEFDFDLVITDIEMPRLDGFSLTEKLRNSEKNKDIPIILVSSRDKEGDKRRGLEVGADAYIIKGDFDQTSLLDTVRNIVG
ncbi:MAG: response regulator [Syntrophales bacterium]|nr:response regulator [Syntrophales bacterium]